MVFRHWRLLLFELRMAIWAACVCQNLQQSRGVLRQVLKSRGKIMRATLVARNDLGFLSARQN